MDTQSDKPKETLEQTCARIKKEDAAFYDDCFTNPVTKIPYNVPADIKRLARRICGAYGIRGLCDPMYIANVIAFELGRGDGQSTFTEAEKTIEDVIVYEGKHPDFPNAEYFVVFQWLLDVAEWRGDRPRAAFIIEKTDEPAKYRYIHTHLDPSRIETAKLLKPSHLPKESRSVLQGALLTYSERFKAQNYTNH